MSEVNEDELQVTAEGLSAEQLSQILNGTMDPVALLKHVAETAPDKQSRKEARRALYKLSQGGVQISISSGIQAGIQPAQPRAFATAVDGAGNRLLMFHMPDRDGGNPTVVELLINDETGVERCTAARVSRQGANEIVEALYGQMDAGLAFAPIGYEYARHLMREAREINRAARSSTPDGFLDWYERIGQPEQKEVASQVTVLPNPDEETRAISDIFTLVWFDGWFFDVKDIVRLVEGEVNGESVNALDSASVARALLTDRMRAFYERRLRESADILILRGNPVDARLALLCARELASDKPAEESEFALALAARSVQAAGTIAAPGAEEQ